MSDKRTFRQLLLSLLALRNGFGHTEIGARVGLKRGRVAVLLGRRRKTEIDDATYERLLPGVTSRKAASSVMSGCLESLDALDAETDLAEEELAAIEDVVLGAGRLVREILAAAVRRSREAPPEEDYPNPFEVADDRRKATKQLDVLRRLPPRARLAVVKRTPECHTWALVERCCEESIEETSRSLERAAAWARLALAIAKWVKAPEGWHLRLRGYALAHWANVQRVKGNLDAAEAVLGKAKRLWLAGFDPSAILDPGRMLDLEGSLRRGQRRFAEALDLFDQAVAVGHRPERILIMKATTYDVMGEHQQAVAVLLEAGPLVERRSDPRLLYMQRFNLAANYCQLGRHPEAAELVSRVRELVTARNDKIETARVIWLEGRILAGLGQPEEALRLLIKARRRFATEAMFYDVALALLEEAALLLDAGRAAEVKVLSLELMTVFQSKGVHREALAALHLFEDAVEREAATAELARRVLRYLFRARHDQGLRFES